MKGHILLHLEKHPSMGGFDLQRSHMLPQLNLGVHETAGSAATPGRFGSDSGLNYRWSVAGHRKIT